MVHVSPLSCERDGAGVLIDRKHLLIAADLMRAGLILALAVTMASGLSTPSPRC